MIVVDNGSAVPPTAAEFSHLGIDLTVVRMEIRRPARWLRSTAASICRSGPSSASTSTPPASPRPACWPEARAAIEHDPRAFVGSRGRYLGPELQRDSMTKGYHQRSEDLL